MKNENRSFKYLAVAALAFTAGAVRWEADLADGRDAGFYAVGDSRSADLACNRLDAAWLGDCTHPEVVLATR